MSLISIFFHTSTLTPLLGDITVGAMNVVWKVNTKIAQSLCNTNHKSPLRARVVINDRHGRKTSYKDVMDRQTNGHVF